MSFDAPHRIIVIGDVHGDSDRLISALKAAKVLSAQLEWIANPPNTFVVQMGDQLDSKDRVPHAPPGWETHSDVALMDIMDHFDSLARPHGGRVISLVGNHEVMNLLGDFTYASDKSIAESGGALERKQRFMPGMPYANALLNRYVIVKIGRHLFCHAGLLPTHLNIVGENIGAINTAFWDFLRTGRIENERQKQIMFDIVIGMDGILWNRRYAQSMSQSDLAATLHIVLKTTKTTTMFIGHNTVPHIMAAAGGSLVFTDAAFSRAYGGDSFQYVEIVDDIMNVIEVKNE
jgi:hypothetical protein